MTDETPTPARCPACGSREVMTTSKVVTQESYWRCEACGEVWNARRRREPSRNWNDRPRPR